jgi:DNA-binding NtrC family response regulator
MSDDPKSILVVDDEATVREFLAEILGEAGHRVVCVERGEEALERLKEEHFDLVLTDMRLPGIDGLKVLEGVREGAPETAVVVITAYGSISGAVQAMKQGAFDYLSKPFTADAVELVTRKAFEVQRLRAENRALRSQIREKYSYENIVGKSAPMQAIFQQVETVAPRRATVLLSGETGTGKELIARAIHIRSPRKDRPFIKLNCAALPETLMESELFGHEKGAFTGAIRQNRGRFELAHGGTILLDEISEVAPVLQAKILRVLQEREFERLGSGTPIKVDVRVIATTNRDPKALVEEGKLRSDLYYRLNVLAIHLPPLRDHREDIPLLVQHFIRKYNEENGCAVAGLSRPALEKLVAYDWPGNVRELENAIERAVITTKGIELLPENFTLIPFATAPSSPPLSIEAPAGSSINEAERDLILRTLEAHGGNRSRAAAALGISARTLRNKLHKYGLMSAFKEASPPPERNPRCEPGPGPAVVPKGPEG